MEAGFDQTAAAPHTLALAAIVLSIIMGADSSRVRHHHWRGLITGPAQGAAAAAASQPPHAGPCGPRARRTNINNANALLRGTAEGGQPWAAHSGGRRR